MLHIAPGPLLHWHQLVRFNCDLGNISQTMHIIISYPFVSIRIQVTEYESVDGVN